MIVPLVSEAGHVQFPLVRHATAVGWELVSDAEALEMRRGEGGWFFYETLREWLLALNPGVVLAENVSGIIQRTEAVPPTIEGNRELLEWLRGNRTVFVEAEKRHRNVRVIDFEHPEENRWHAS